MLSDWQLNEGASESAIRDAAASLGTLLPSDYEQFMREHDGGEGYLGEEYLILWRVAQLQVFNREYEVDKYASGLLLFGSSGGGEGYGFNLRDPALPIVRVPFVGMDLQHVLPVARTFTDFLDELEKSL